MRACACVVLVAEMCALKHAHAGKHAGLIQACPRFSPFDVSTRPLTVSANQFSNPRMAKSRCHRVFASSCVTNVAGSRISLPKRVFAFVRSKKVARQINKRLVRERCALCDGDFLSAFDVSLQRFFVFLSSARPEFSLFLISPIYSATLAENINSAFDARPRACNIEFGS